jgi:hypothetical protein
VGVWQLAAAGAARASKLGGAVDSAWEVRGPVIAVGSPMSVTLWSARLSQKAARRVGLPCAITYPEVV